MCVSATHRDIADFFRLAVEIRPRHPLVDLAEIVSWADGAILASDVAAPWMIDVSLAQTLGDAVHCLRKVPSPATDNLGASILIAYIDRKWRQGAIDSEDTCFSLARIGDELPSDLESDAKLPSWILDDEMSSFPGDRPPDFKRVNNAISDFVTPFRKFDSLIPVAL